MPRFDQRLALNRYLLSLFGMESFEALASELKDPALEELDADNVSRFFWATRALPRIGEPGLLTADELRRYDDNIVSHTLAISANRGGRIRWKYFQYLALLFTEVYLDRYFTAAGRLLDDLNAYRMRLNNGPLAAGRIEPFEPDDLRTLAFWMATGSGKTLLMHVHILQFRHYLRAHGRERDINRTILITPNEGLSAQHLAEFGASGLEAELFAKAGMSLFAGHAIEIIDIHKLAEESGEKTVAVDAFERNNLVLIDEGHRGAGGVDWKDKRDRLSERGFAFEYSATFGQAINAATAARRERLVQEYAKAILFDYSYRFFYADGYGKDYQILNLAEDEGDAEHLYLVAALLSFYQQLRVCEERRHQLAPYGVERPLWVFVGSSVTQKLVRAEGTDIQRILAFLARFARERAESVALLDRLLSGDTGLVANGRDLFAGKFSYLRDRLPDQDVIRNPAEPLGFAPPDRHSDQREESPREALDGEAGASSGVRAFPHSSPASRLVAGGSPGAYLLPDILRRLFNAPGGGRLRVEELKGADGELALRLGDAEPFGVINIGDARGLAKLLEDDPAIDVVAREVGRSVFARLAEPDSRIHVLIGSKKFTEGWNSYRVASLGLMNVGKSEGAQIIQLFGRGVRLRGLDGSLKRSTHLPGLTHPYDALRHLETLSIYGLRADYMAQFKQLLEAEGLPKNDAVHEIELPTIARLPAHRTLKTIRTKGDKNFLTDGPRVLLAEPWDSFATITLDCRPRVQVMLSEGLADSDTAADEETRSFGPEHLAFLDLPALHAALVRYKDERGWTNLAIPRDLPGRLLSRSDWYALEIDAAALGFDGPDPLRRIPLWQEIALTLLKKYVEQFYKRARNAFEAPLREYAPLTADDANMLKHYHVVVHQSPQTYLPELEKLKRQLEDGRCDVSFIYSLALVKFDRHLYQPLLTLRGSDLKIVPAPLNTGERDFIRDLKTYFETHQDWFASRELYLLRNQSRGKGIGFFEANNFYPDFILWLLDGDHQHIAFVDPKGIRNLVGIDDPKIAFAQEIKTIEHQLGDPTVSLHSFIVSNTPYRDIKHWKETQPELEARNVLFQGDDRMGYIAKLFACILDPAVAAP